MSFSYLQRFSTYILSKSWVGAAESAAGRGMGMAAVSHGDDGDAEADPERVCHEERDVQDQGQAPASGAEPCGGRAPTNQGHGLILIPSYRFLPPLMALSRYPPDIYR